MISKLINDLMNPIRSLFASAREITNQPAALKAQAQRIKQIPKEVMGEANRLKDSAKAAKDDAKAAADKLGKAKGAAQGAQAAAQGAAAQAKGAAGQAQAAAGQAQAAGQAAQAQPKKAKKKMGLFGKKNVCPNCGQPQEKSWDKCPFCINMQGAMGGANPGGAAPPPPPAGGATGAYGGFGAPPGGGGGAQKTMMFQQGGAAAGASSAQLGWVIPLKGPHKGELHTLKPQTVIGRDPTCDVCFNDTVMSSRHATIRANAGKFILEDHSTNGTFVNDKRVTSHDLVDNDFIKFGNTLVKFKSLT